MLRGVWGAAALLALWTMPALAQDQAQEVPISEEARAHFKAGVNLLQDPDGARYEEAYREFKAAYAASPSWKILGNLGIAALKLERDGEALEAFERYLQEGGDQIAPEERAQVQRDIETLRAGVVRLTVSSSPPGARLLDERIPTSGPPIRNAYGPLDGPTTLGLRAGHHRLTAQLEGYPDVVWEVDVSPRQELTHVFELSAAPAAVGTTVDMTPASPTPPAATNSTLRTASYVALGVGVLGLGAGTVFGLSAKSKYDEGNELCPSFPCSLTAEEADRREQLGEDGDSAKTLSLVGFIAGGVGVAAGVTLFVLSGRPQERSAPSVSTFVSPNSVGLRGSF